MSEDMPTLTDWEGGEWNLCLVSPCGTHRVQVYPSHPSAEVEQFLVGSLKEHRGIEILDVRGEVASIPYRFWMEWMVLWQRGGLNGEGK